MKNLVLCFICFLIQLILINSNLLYSNGNGSNNNMISEMYTTNCKLENGLISLKVDLDNGYYSITSNAIEFKN